MSRKDFTFDPTHDEHDLYNGRLNKNSGLHTPVPPNSPEPKLSSQKTYSDSDYLYISNACLHVARETLKICRDDWYTHKANTLITKSHEMSRYLQSTSLDAVSKLIVVSDCTNILTYLLQMSTIDRYSHLHKPILDCIYASVGIESYLTSHLRVQN